MLLETDIALLDMGAEYHCYCSDITCSMPVAKTFSPDQKLVYEGVLNAVRAVMELLKPGCDWQVLLPCCCPAVTGRCCPLLLPCCDWQVLPTAAAAATAAAPPLIRASL